MFGVFFNYNMISCHNYFFQRVWGVYKIAVEIPKGWGGEGYFSSQKMEIRGKRGAYVKFPPWWDYGYFLELHNPVVKLYLKHVRVEDMIY